jgi:hypothetical protein
MSVPTEHHSSRLFTQVTRIKGLLVAGLAQDLGVWTIRGLLILGVKEVVANDSHSIAHGHRIDSPPEMLIGNGSRLLEPLRVTVPIPHTTLIA